MATNDLLAHHGAKSSNFLDLGGQAYHEKVTASLVIMEKNEDTDAIIVNVYCGQLPADKIAVVIREAFEKKYVTKPIVCRIKGTNANDANKILVEMKHPKIHCVSDFNEAALKVIELGDQEREKKKKDAKQVHKHHINPVV